MELSIDEAVKKGVEAHKAGRIQEADRLYTAILKVQPNHPDVNHNMGALAVSLGREEQALPFFRLALEANPKIQRFWLSYLDALMELGCTEEAQSVIFQAKVSGVNGPVLDKLQANLDRACDSDSKLLPDEKGSGTPNTNISSNLKLDKALRLAKKKLKNGHREDAKRIYQGILAEFPENRKAISGLKILSANQPNISSNTQEPPQGLIQPLIELYEKKKYTELLQACAQSKKQFPNSVTVLNILGLANSRLGKLATAIETFQSALKLKPDSAEIYNNMGNAQKRSGDLGAAIESLQRALKFRPDYTEAYYNIGAAFQENGEPDVAIQNYQRALKLKPNYVEVYNDMGNALQSTGELDAAIESYRRAIKLQPNYAEAHNNMGAVLKDKGNLQAAIDSYHRALAINSGYVETYNNLGIALKESGNLDEAIENFQRALSLNPSYADAYLSMGNALQDKGEHASAAIDNYRKALELRPDYAEAYNNMGIAQQEKGEIDAAIESYQQALKLRPDYDHAYVNVGNILKDIRFTKPVFGLEGTILELLRRKRFVIPNDIAVATTSLLKLNSVVIKALGFVSETPRYPLLADTIRTLSNVPLFVELMKVSLIPDLEIEALLRIIRSEILFNYEKLLGDQEILSFCSTLALQCFTNEYIYSQSIKEDKALDDLEQSVVKLLENGQQPEPLAIACLASYNSLNNYSWHHLLSIADSLPMLEIRQLEEPRQESKLCNEISILQELEDDISSKVREQYEENPYPRWVNVPLHLKSKSISQLTKGLELKIPDSSILSADNPEILIAGGGTGQHTIISSSRYRNARVLCIDLSLSSLAYAKRKTLELEISNIDYLQADILCLETLSRKFDIIESSGVLHHMNDPMTGWKVLTNCLKPGGLIRIGLYSELARQHIIRMRRINKLNQVGSTKTEIRSFRDMVISSKLDDHTRIASSPDFFSMSTLRDLIFHVQEHQFTIPQLKRCLSELGLEFCGFEIGSETIGRRFKLEFSDKEDLYDLEKWASFENNNPTAFAAMYQFWCQKVA